MFHETVATDRVTRSQDTLYVLVTDLSIGMKKTTSRPISVYYQSGSLLLIFNYDRLIVDIVFGLVLFPCN